MGDTVLGTMQLLFGSAAVCRDGTVARGMECGDRAEVECGDVGPQTKAEH